MGTGKSSAAINYMNTHPENKYIYITPYLSESRRICRECKDLKFVEPSNKLKEFKFKKSVHTGELIKEGRNISTTHQAFRGYTTETLDNIKKQGYTLIIDENVEILEKFSYHPTDLQIAVNAGYIKEENGIYTLARDDYDGKALKEMIYLLKSRELIRITDVNKGYMYFWALTPELLTSFNDVYILTYLFKGQSLKYFMDIYSLSYTYIGIQKTDDGKYEFGEYQGYTPEYTKDIRSKLKILNNPKMNEVGDEYYSLSMSWYDKKDKEVNKLRKNINNYYNNIWRDVPSDKRMWGTYKGDMSKVKGKGYTKAFVTFNTKATNQYKDKDCLVYVSNIFMNVSEKKFYKKHGIKIDEDTYALSVMLQWIWRSAIREGGTVNLYIPSKRMRTLLENWMEEVSGGENKNE